MMQDRFFHQIELVSQIDRRKTADFTQKGTLEHKGIRSRHMMQKMFCQKMFLFLHSFRLQIRSLADLFQFSVLPVKCHIHQRNLRIQSLHMPYLTFHFIFFVPVIVIQKGNISAGSFRNSPVSRCCGTQIFLIYQISERNLIFFLKFFRNRCNLFGPVRICIIIHQNNFHSFPGLLCQTLQRLFQFPGSAICGHHNRNQRHTLTGISVVLFCFFLFRSTLLHAIPTQNNQRC